MSIINIKYRYAVDRQGNIVDVFNLTEDDRDDYSCLGCGRILRPVLPKERQKHFKHKMVADCSLETYLHRMGIRLFQENYQTCLDGGLSFILELPQQNICRSCVDGPCDKENTSYAINLPSIYDNLSVEKHDHVNGRSFIPDILLSGNGTEKIYVEIVYSHKSEQEKIDSGVPIIEIDINKEDDFEFFSRRHLSAFDKQLRLYNFPTKTVEIDFTEKCHKYIKKVFVKKHHFELKNELIDYYRKAVLEGKPFEIRLRRPYHCNSCEGGPCLNGEYKIEYFDLISYFEELITEDPLPGDDIPRIAIVSKSGRKLYFEVECAFRMNASHRSVISKGDEIIEITGGGLPSQAGGLNSWPISYNLHNITPKPLIVDLKYKCIKKIYCFKVLKSGKARIDQILYSEYKQLKSVGDFIYLNEVKGDGHDNFIMAVENAYSSGVRVKNCYICRYHAGVGNSRFHREGSNGAIFCKFLRLSCGSNRAAKCEYFRPDPKVIGTERYPDNAKW